MGGEKMGVEKRTWNAIGLLRILKMMASKLYPQRPCTVPARKTQNKQKAKLLYYRVSP